MTVISKPMSIYFQEPGRMGPFYFPHDRPTAYFFHDPLHSEKKILF